MHTVTVLKCRHEVVAYQGVIFKYIVIYNHCTTEALTGSKDKEKQLREFLTFSSYRGIQVHIAGFSCCIIRIDSQPYGRFVMNSQ